MTMPREKCAVASLNSVGVFVFGGSATNNKGSSDFLAAGSMQWQEGPALPEDMTYGPCAVSITATSFLVIYGTNIHQFDSTSQSWGRWPSLKAFRILWPGCAKIGQKVIIAGGYGGGVLRSTEVLDLGTREITAGGDMATPRYWFHLGTIRRGGEEEKVLALGGVSLNTVEEWVEESGTWKRAASLAGEKGYFGAVTVPKEFLCPV